MPEYQIEVFFFESGESPEAVLGSLRMDLDNAGLAYEILDDAIVEVED